VQFFVRWLMSYNVDTWKTKELVDLVIPVASLFKHERSDWHPRKERHDDGSFTFSVMEESYINGTIEIVDHCDFLRVTYIQASGEGSGTALRWIIEPALADGRGKLVASRVWEGGDSIDRLTVIDGVVSSEPIEI
jgi:hypothetical protein